MVQSAATARLRATSSGGDDLLVSHSISCGAVGDQRANSGVAPIREAHAEAREEQALHPLFVILEDKRLLRYGYGPISGIVELSDLASRIDAIRDTIRPALAALEPDAPSAVWLEKLGTACQQLLTETYRAMSVRDVAPEASDVAPAVNQLRQLFATVASEVWEVYELPAARNLAVHIHDDIGRSDAWERGHE